MNIEGSRILITGAAGGIGCALALQLAQRGATLLLSGRAGHALSSVCSEASRLGARVFMLEADLLEVDAAERLAAQARTAAGGVDILVNLAGISSFKLFQNEDAAGIERLWQVNVIAPLTLTRALLPAMLARGSGRVVNIGSIFGSIGFACFANYSATKSAIHGFSQALRRELDGSGVGVSYVAPRYTRTALNTSAVNRMAAAVKMPSDSPEQVASHIVRAIEQDRDELYIGFPESLFVRINAVLPRIVDFALRRQNRTMRDFAAPTVNHPLAEEPQP
jgi:short-subunit dehydrogenase